MTSRVNEYKHKNNSQRKDFKVLKWSLEHPVLTLLLICRFVYLHVPLQKSNFQPQTLTLTFTVNEYKHKITLSNNWLWARKSELPNCWAQWYCTCDWFWTSVCSTRSRGRDQPLTTSLPRFLQLYIFVAGMRILAVRGLTDCNNSYSMRYSLKTSRNPKLWPIHIVSRIV